MDTCNYAANIVCRNKFFQKVKKNEKSIKKRLPFSFELGIMIKLSMREQNEYATVAQSVEQLIRNQQVAGSSPASSSKKSS